MTTSMTENNAQLKQVYETVLYHLETIYQTTPPAQPLPALAEEIIQIMRLDKEYQTPAPYQNNWDEKDMVLITYGNTIQKANEAPLKTLNQFLKRCVKDTVSSVHILPFSPYCSDDGFAVKDYYAINPDLGEWDDIEGISKDYRLMADLVINHGSSSSEWFQNFIKGKGGVHLVIPKSILISATLKS